MVAEDARSKTEIFTFFFSPGRCVSMRENELVKEKEARAE